METYVITAYSIISLLAFGPSKAWNSSCSLWSLGPHATHVPLRNDNIKKISQRMSSFMNLLVSYFQAFQ